MNKFSRQKIYIYDLDMTVIDSSHRTPNKPDGTLDLQKYFELKTRENVFKDKLLPLSNHMRRMFLVGHAVFICTAREVNADDIDFLHDNKLRYHRMYSRNGITKEHYFMSDGPYKVTHLRPLVDNPLQKIMFEDSKPVVEALKIELPTFTIIQV